jgi:hypothetical protein
VWFWVGGVVGRYLQRVGQTNVRNTEQIGLLAMGQEEVTT